MKKFRGAGFSDRKWITLICLLLAIEIIWLLADLHLISLPFRSRSKSAEGAIEAGHIIKSQEDVEKRSADSLIWEPAKQDDILYYHDSVLTLGQSTATLYLKDQTELQMAENTLVTFEEPEAQSNAEIRLRFAKGDVKARNPFNTSKIETSDWVVHLEKGAELAMRKEQSGYEFEVLAGHATLNTEAGKEDLVESKIIKLNDDKKIETIDKSLDLKWSKPETERIYTFNDSASVPVSWSGSAQKLQISRPGAEKPVEKIQAVAPKQAAAEIKLEPGNYQLRLEDEKGISSPKTVEVVKAPKIYLKKPLPRDRIQIGTPLEFVWESEKPLKGYNLKLSNGQSFEVSDNFKAVSFDKPQNIEWTIEARDADGFKIPSMYQSQVYLVNDALAAPKLKQPKMIDEASPENQELLKGKSPAAPRKSNKKIPDSGRAAPEDGEKSAPDSSAERYGFLEKAFAGWLQNKFFVFESFAHAQVLRKKNVVFEWEPVEGANQYIIEISSDPEFKNPEVNETLKGTRYTWKKYDPKKKYFWRVASGNTNGRMGLFSEATPLEVIIEKPEAPERSGEAKNISVPENEKPKENPAVSKEKEAAASDTTAASKPIQIGEAPLYSGQARWSFAYAPGYKAASIPGEQNTKVDLNGIVPLAFDFKYRTSEENERLYFIDFYASAQTWKSKNEVAGVTQPDLKYNEVFLSLRTAEKDSDWQFGLTAHTDFYSRVDGPAINTENLTFLGAEAAKILNPNWTLEGGYMISGSFSEAKLAALYKNYFSLEETNDTSKYFYGVNLISVIQSGSYGAGQQTQLQVLLGISGF
jgi:hypothetical protein